MNRKLSMNFKDMNDAELNKLTLVIMHCMNDNTNFPYSEPMLSSIEKLQKQHLQAMSEAGRGDQYKISIRNDIRASLIPVLKQLGEYVEVTSNGQMTPLLSSGFPLAKERGPAILEPPKDFRVQPGPKNGEIILRIRRVIGAKSYLYQYTRDPLTKDSVWETKTGTRCKGLLVDLPLGVKFWFRMAAIGSKDQIVYTEPLARYIS